MSKKLYTLICTIITLVCGATSAVLEYVAPPALPAIIGTLNVLEGASITALGLWVVTNFERSEKNDLQQKLKNMKV